MSAADLRAAAIAQGCPPDVANAPTRTGPNNNRAVDPFRATIGINGASNVPTIEEVARGIATHPERENMVWLIMVRMALTAPDELMAWHDRIDGAMQYRADVLKGYEL